MNLAANASNRGYAMAALLVAMAVMAVLLSVAMPTWNQLIRREKEEELIFRGNQYARAIRLYGRATGPGNPPSVDVLVERRFLRKKFKDPMSTEKSGEFQLLYLSNSGPASRAGAAGQGGSQTGAGQPGVGQTSSVGSMLGTTPNGQFAGVASKNTGESIRTYNGKNHYNEWQFVGTEQSAQAGTGAGGSGRGGGRGGGAQRGDGRGDGGPGGRGGRDSSDGRRGGGGRQGDSGGRGFLPPGQGPGQGQFQGQGR